MIPVFVVAHPDLGSRYKYIMQHVSQRMGNNFETVGVIGKDADAATYLKNPELSVGEFGCALAHLNAYRLLLEQDAKCAFVIEDDAVLPENIADIVEHMAKIINDGEIIQLYNWTSRQMKFCTPESESTPYGTLYYPLDASHIGSLPAYLISRSAAEGFLKANYPVRATADNFQFFKAHDAFKTCRVLYPFAVKLRPFESTIWKSDIRSQSGAGNLITTLARLILSPFKRAARSYKTFQRRKEVTICDTPSDLQP